MYEARFPSYNFRDAGMPFSMRRTDASGQIEKQENSGADL
jgi:hypothetical protein